ncbi:proton-coupled amino acid transporter 1 [Fopius arisanus]|uniref:Proton-coupled amino acid transporter 1 n=1 Tax=Fopius arisanus TaxID=64838 RepID=A0A9R1U521_9HYME|nr:PREDICTED: proton-coupled amino acid transporter 1 [Fopius arisanus]
MSRDNHGFVGSSESVGVKDGRYTATSTEKSEKSAKSNNDVFTVELKNWPRTSKEFAVEYDPYAHREVAHPTTTLDTLFHLLKGSLGTGILAMPLAFSHAGYAIGIIGTLVIGFLCTYCIRLLIRSEYELCKRRRVPSLTYEATAQAAIEEGPKFLRPLAPAVPHIVNIFLLVYQLGTCCVYVVFISENLKSAIDSYVTPIKLEYYMLATLLPLIFINWIRNLKLLAPFSTAANGITLASFGIILYFIFRDPISFEGKHAVGTVQDFPLFFGTVLFALEAIGVMIPLENEMDNPKKFMTPFGVLNSGMSLIIVLYVGMGLFGYVRYGTGVKGSITLNLPDDDVLAKIVQILLAISIYVTHALQCYPAIDISWNVYLSKRIKERKLMWEYIVRTGLVLITFFLAMAVPRLELFISLFGALCLSALGLAFPAIIETCAFWSVQDSTQNCIMLAKNTSLILFGLLGLVVGTYTSLSKIIESFS